MEKKITRQGYKLNKAHYIQRTRLNNLHISIVLKAYLLHELEIAPK